MGKIKMVNKEYDLERNEIMLPLLPFLFFEMDSQSGKFGIK